MVGQPPPGTYSVMSYGTHEYGGGPEPANHEGHDVGGTSVADLHGPSEGRPDVHFELTARAPRSGSRRGASSTR